ncbi:Uncharacterized protein OS=Singulisphaera acidiphila (strain ATCC BAA-1392 / DSM 18658 / VKM B-2454 / MOB10) GN=Sinac_3498 PE=4 SV=1: TerB [Gemmataceae bacterium]|nr:Uncharacterized protein OS=Singulisphaera acidiphila (strain ATCC BAA-1392 / DSM 18658 / VKM B-2454 / MOB10) GN=Sinac_3498 PE=4 SV=1: TerB [Gemmataceae bacterium]VTT99615.1 Uncharacterized protein OS=Singulisphaera acidiphila (strain ATCC BAA-1392 / DSM 18658 / VKM B-2454 / MOB10) GN=Sinac_3498 PE=4 SV=1: TerB [Gemmataceae bacterium]
MSWWIDPARPGGRTRYPVPKWESNVPQLRALMEKFLADGKIDGREIDTLGELLPPDRPVSRAEAEFLIEMHKRVERVTPAFERFFYRVIKRHVLADGVIDAREAAWLRRMILADGRVDEREKKLLRELKGEATRASPEFEALFAECVK